MPVEVAVPVSSDADIIGARTRAREVARSLGFTDTATTLIATAVSEVARNILVHAIRGSVTFERLQESGRSGLRVVARDAGPGIADLARAMEDGYSTAGGLGIGLPGSRRLMDEFHVDTTVGEGTVVSMTKWLS
jgi:serine/threonine-protein kinase RsbT